MKKILRGFGKAICYFTLFFALQFFVSVVVSSVLAFNMMVDTGLTTVPEEQFTDIVLKLQSEVLEYATLISLISSVISLAFIWVFFRLRKKALTEQISMRKCSIPMFVASLMFGVSFLMIVPGLVQLIPFPEKMVTDFNQSHAVLSTGNPIIGFIAVVLLGPVTEEVFFRGLIYTRIKEGTNVIAAAVISSLLFGVLHGEIIWIIITFIMGIMLVWVFEKTKSLVPCIAIHIANNALAQLTSDGLEIADWTGGFVFALCVICMAVSFGYIFKHQAKNPPAQDDTSAA